MKRKQIFFVVYFIGVACCLQAQKDSVAIELNSFSLSISKVKDFSKGYNKRLIPDSLVARNIRSLTDVLKFNSFIYFKENGLGMVSSPSFRGTNATQTAVIWNGINVNSQLNGQTDFNALSANSYDHIIVRSGGGSVLFGSGAIGGSIHLNNTISFLDEQSHKLLLNYGSFNTQHVSYDFVKSTGKSFFNIGFGYNASDNDFEYLNSNLNNENGSFNNFNFDVNYGYKINDKNQLKFFTNSFFSDRDLSRTLNAPSNDSYEDINSKNLLEWSYFISPKEVLTSRVAYIFEKFTYFDDNTNKSLFSTGTTNRKVAKLDYNNYISRKTQVNAILGFDTTSASGSSFSSNQRGIFSAVFSLNQQLTKKLSFGLQLRKEFLEDFKSPFLYSLGIEHKFNQNYTISFNTSKNFRIPTFNDLYWQPGGNSNLEPEKSYQLELGNKIDFNNFSFQLSGFYISSSDLIQWIPNQSNVWSPINVNSTRNLGLEVSLNYVKVIRDHHLEMKINYSYTDAKDLQTNRQLISVPRNRANFLIDYKYKNFSAYYQQLLNDEVSFLVDVIPSFTVANIGLNYKISSIKKQPTVGVQINNVYNSYYQNTLNRPMPGLNFQITTNINF